LPRQSITFSRLNRTHVNFSKNGRLRSSKSLTGVSDWYNTQNTLINFVQPIALFDNNGWLTDPESVSFSGAWAQYRAAGLLPSDYRDSDNKNTLADTASTTLTSLLSKLDSFTIKRPTEKVYLHLDKNNYDMGDTVWYKAYTVIGTHHQLSALSGVLYVDLTGPSDKIIARQVLHLVSGVAWGSLPLPVQVKPGDYYIRAYTNWMRNDAPDYFFHQKIHIGGFEATTKARITDNKPDVQFFPEGGELVDGLRSKVAFKVVGANGYGIDVKGRINDNTGNVVADVATRHLGMGVFAFTPQSGKNYKLEITSGETVLSVPLPQAKTEGYVFGINNSDPDSIFIKVAANEALFKHMRHSGFYIVARSGGKTYYTATGKLEDMIFTASIDKKRFPSGIAQFTLCSENGEPLNERSIFIQNADTLKLAMKITKSAALRGKVMVDLHSGGSDDAPAAGTFSVSVVNESLTADDELSQGSIFSHLLLTSDLKGYVEQPGYYFTNPDEKTRADLDVLMLTQGYSRFEWKPILDGNYPAITYQPESTLHLSGSVSTPGGKPIPGGTVTLIGTKNRLMTDTVTDANGHFNFTGLELPDSASVILSAKKMNKSTSVDIHIDSTDYPPIIRPDNHGVPFVDDDTTKATDATNSNQQERTDFLNRKHQLKGVTIKARYVRKKPDLHNSDNLNGPGHADQIIMADDLKDAPSLYDALVGKLNGVDLNIDRFDNVTAINRRVHGMHQPSKMILDIDGNLSPGTTLNEINPKIIHSIEVLTSPANLMIYGYDVGGVFVITTKRAGDKDFMDTPPAPGTIQYTFNGFYKIREFYSPKYDNPQGNTTIPDLRSTIYWNPNLVTDKDGKASFEYFNSDTKGVYRVVVEGIDGNGDLGRQVFKYSVE
jgi:hypothetical protein